MSTFYAESNEESTKNLFAKRLMYNVEMTGKGHRHLVNFNFGEKLLYGRVNYQYVPIVLNYGSPLTKLKVQQYAISQGIYNLTYVTTAFTAMVKEFERRIMAGQITADSKYLSKLQAYKGLQNPVQAYKENLKKYSAAFVDMFRQQDVKVKNFDEFVTQFMAILQETQKFAPFTQSGYIKSTHMTVMNTGLGIEIADLNPANDDAKIQEFIEDPNWECYVELCRRHGFMIDRNIPWRIVADIESPGMKQFTTGLGLGSSATILNGQFRPGYDIDIQIFQESLLNLYNAVRRAYRVPVACADGTQRLKTMYPVAYTSRSLAEAYPPEYFMDLYCRLRFIEEESYFAVHEQKILINDTLELAHLHGKVTALKYFEIVLNKPFDYRGSLSYIEKSNVAYQEAELEKEGIPSGNTNDFSGY